MNKKELKRQNEIMKEALLSIRDWVSYVNYKEWKTTEFAFIVKDDPDFLKKIASDSLEKCGIYFEIPKNNKEVVK
jgi:hypothetical protein